MVRRSSTSTVDNFEVAIVGGGPAGLSAALTLSLAGKRSVLFDSGTPRNARSVATHGFLTHDRTAPSDLRSMARAEVAEYGLTEFRHEQVVDVVEIGSGFPRVVAESGAVDVRFVILAMGMVDELPAVPGLAEAWGHGVIHCPFCQGSERRATPWAVLASSEDDIRMAPRMLGWADELTLLVSPLDRATELSFDAVATQGIRVERRGIVAIDGGPGRDRTVVEFDSGDPLRVGALVLRPRQHHTPLIRALDLAIAPQGYVVTSDDGETSMAGVYAVGDATSGHQAVLVAAASGMVTARAVSFRLTLEAVAGV